MSFTKRIPGSLRRSKDKDKKGKIQIEVSGDGHEEPTIDATKLSEVFGDSMTTPIEVRFSGDCTILTEGITAPVKMYITKDAVCFIGETYNKRISKTLVKSVKDFPHYAENQIQLKLAEDAPAIILKDLSSDVRGKASTLLHNLNRRRSRLSLSLSSSSKKNKQDLEKVFSESSRESQEVSTSEAEHSFDLTNSEVEKIEENLESLAESKTPKQQSTSSDGATPKKKSRSKTLSSMGAKLSVPGSKKKRKSREIPFPIETSENTETLETPETPESQTPSQSSEEVAPVEAKEQPAVVEEPRTLEPPTDPVPVPDSSEPKKEAPKPPVEEKQEPVVSAEKPKAAQVVESKQAPRKPITSNPHMLLLLLSLFMIPFGAFLWAYYYVIYLTIVGLLSSIF